MYFFNPSQFDFNKNSVKLNRNENEVIMGAVLSSVLIQDLTGLRVDTLLELVSSGLLYSVWNKHERFTQ